MVIYEMTLKEWLKDGQFRRNGWIVGVFCMIGLTMLAVGLIFGSEFAAR
jgi:hypothetical protein